jgi:hypothetical protein
MRTRHCLFAIGSLLFIFLISGPATGSGKTEEQAIEASHAWLTLVDNGRYDDSWESAARYFRNAVSKDQWQQSLSAARKPLGKVLKRTIKSSQYATSLPGAPDGKYVVIQYETSFANKKTSIETITPMLDKDGKWRVSGYYIK